MNTTEATLAAVDPQAFADLEALMRHHTEGTPIDPELSRRVKERANRIMEKNREKYGYVDVDKLLREARDEVEIC